VNGDEADEADEEAPEDGNSGTVESRQHRRCSCRMCRDVVGGVGRGRASYFVAFVSFSCVKDEGMASNRDNPCDSNIVVPQDEADTHTRLVIDSRDRNLTLHPTPDKYSLSLDNDVRDVRQIRLIAAELPSRTAYLIDVGRDTVHYRLDSDPAGAAAREARLERGNYATPGELATEVESAMNATADDASTFAVSHNPRTDRFEVASKFPFVMLCRGEDRPDHGGVRMTGTYREGTACRVLGMRNADVRSADDGSGGTRPHLVRAPFRKDFDGVKGDYTVLRVGGATTNVGVTPGLHDSFAILKPDELRADTQMLRAYVHTYDPPVSRFNRLDVSFHSYDGSAYNFQNRDHRLEFLLVSRRQRKICPA